MATTTTISPAEQIIRGLRKAAVELEEFRLQAALGKAEARDRYELSKKKLNHFLHRFQSRVNKTGKTAKTVALKLQVMVEELGVQLALGKAETRDAFERQRKNILKALNRIEQFIHKQQTLTSFYAELLHEIGKFRIKLEILRLRFQLNRLDVKEEFEKKKNEFSSRLSELKERMKRKKEPTRLDYFRKEMNGAYEHLKKAFAKP